MFNTSAEGCGFFSPNILIRYNVSIKRSRIDNESLIKKNRKESLEKKSNRYIKIAVTKDAIIQRIKLVLILTLLKFKIIQFC